MSELLVDAPESLDVEDGDGERPAIAAGARHLAAEELAEAPAIEGAGDGIGDRLLLDELAVLSEALGEPEVAAAGGGERANRPCDGGEAGPRGLQFGARFPGRSGDEGDAFVGLDGDRERGDALGLFLDADLSGDQVAENLACGEDWEGNVEEAEWADMDEGTELHGGNGGGRHFLDSRGATAFETGAGDGDGASEPAAEMGEVLTGGERSAGRTDEESWDTERLSQRVLNVLQSVRPQLVGQILPSAPHRDNLTRDSACSPIWSIPRFLPAPNQTFVIPGGARGVLERSDRGETECGEALGGTSGAGMDETEFGYGEFRFSWGDHICAIFDSHAQQMEVMVPFIAAGLQTGQRCVWVAPEESGNALREALVGIRADPATLEASGQLLIISEVEFYLRGGVFEADRTMELLRRLLDDSRREGYSTMRVASDVSWLCHTDLDPELWERFEARLTREIAKLPVTMVCQYARRQISGPLLVTALRTHPTVIMGDRIHENPYYVPEPVGTSGPQEIM